MSGLSSATPLMRTRPAVLRFSLYYPSVHAEDYESIRTQVTTPIKQLLCEHKFFLISSRVNGENACPQHASMSPSSSAFDMNEPHFGNAEYSVLMETPAFAEESTLGDVSWMSWTVAFYVVQLGQPLIEMASQMSENGNEILTDLKVSEVMNDVLRLALQVSIMEGEMDRRFHQTLPGARVSLRGDEVMTWSDLGIFSDEQISLHDDGGSNNPPQHQLMDPPDSSTTLDAPSQHQHHPSRGQSSPSIVATSMYEYHSLRYSGMGMFATMLIVWMLLIRLGTRRRKLRQKLQYELEQSQRTSKEIQLGTEDQVSEMLQVGSQVFGNAAGAHYDGSVLTRTIS